MKKPAWFRPFPGVWILLGVAIVLAARMALCWPHHPANLKKLAESFSSIAALHGEPVVSQGDRIPKDVMRFVRRTH